MQINAIAQRDASTAAQLVAPAADPAYAAQASSPLQPSGSVGRHYQEAAAARAGFDLNAWDPTRGFAANKQFVWGGYDYYRRLQIAHPELLWAGMAFGIGPTFASGLADLGAFDARLAAVQQRINTLPAPVRDVVLGAAHLGPTTAIKVAHDLEVKLLQMQQAIFLDQGMQHEAYLAQGMDGIRALRASGAIDDHAVGAWQQISDGARTGDRAQIESGNLELLRREQMQTIAEPYDQIRTLTAVSPLVTYLLTAIGRPAIPGAHAASQAIPVRVGPFALPVPGGDISRADDRWRMIAQDTWPAYVSLVEQHPAEFQKMLHTPLDQRIADGHYRHLPDSLSPRDLLAMVLASSGAVRTR